jgi:hypothetical protein
MLTAAPCPFDREPDPLADVPEPTDEDLEMIERRAERRDEEPDALESELDRQDTDRIIRSIVRDGSIPGDTGRW